jgi:hypothetical protein
MDLTGSERDNRGMQSAEKDVAPIEPWAMWIGLATVVLVGAVAAFTAWDRMRESQLEVVVTPTGVGDTQYVAAAATKNGPTGIKYEGTELETVADLKERDSKVLRVGSDDSGVYTIYRPEDEQELPKGRYYMKVRPNEYIEVTGK